MISKTDKDFWNSMYSCKKLPVLINTRSTVFISIHHLLKKYIKKDSRLKLLDVGTTNGRWMVYFKKKFGLQVSGIEYIKEKCEFTKKNLKYCKVKGEVFCEDFFNNSIKELFDYIFSWGFIEHFDPVDDSIRKQVELLADNGKIIAFIPNKKGLNGLLARIFYKKNLESYNMNIMSKESLQKEFINQKLNIIDSGYIGKINLIVLNPESDFQKKRKLLIYPLYLINQILARIWFFESRFFSPYIYVVCKKIKTK